MDITECEILPDGTRRYNTLYRYKIMKNTLRDGQYDIQGEFEKSNVMSDSLRRRLMQFGVPRDVLTRFLGKEFSE
jgi:pilus assembly protein CpaF